MQTIEQRYGLRNRLLLVSALAATLGGAMLAGGDSSANAREAQRPAPIVVAGAMGAASLQPEVENTVTGRVETLAGEPVSIKSDPFGTEVARLADGAEVQIWCQAPGPNAPGDPEDFGKPPMADTTWYRLSPGDSGFNATPQPAQWIPQNPVFTDDPVPSCPPGLMR